MKSVTRKVTLPLTADDGHSRRHETHALRALVDGQHQVLQDLVADQCIREDLVVADDRVDELVARHGDRPVELDAPYVERTVHGPRMADDFGLGLVG